MTPDYIELLAKFQAAEKAEKAAIEAAAPWEDAARYVAKKLTGLEGNGVVKFDSDTFSILCQGTGIYSHEEWWEDFDALPLIEEMQKRKAQKG